MFDENFSFLSPSSSSAACNPSTLYDSQISPLMPVDGMEGDFYGFPDIDASSVAPRFYTLPRSYPRSGYRTSRPPLTRMSSSSSISSSIRSQRRVSIGTLTQRFNNHSLNSSNNSIYKTDNPGIFSHPPTLTPASSTSSLRQPEDSHYCQTNMNVYPLPSPPAEVFDEGFSEPTYASTAPSITTSDPPTPTSSSSPFSFPNFPPLCEESSTDPTSQTSIPTSDPTPSSSSSATLPSHLSHPRLQNRSRFKRRRALTPLDLPPTHLSLLDLIAREERHPSEFDQANDRMHTATGGDWHTGPPHSPPLSELELSLDQLGGKLVPFSRSCFADGEDVGMTKPVRERRSASPISGIAKSSRVEKRGNPSGSGRLGCAAAAVEEENLGNVGANNYSIAVNRGVRMRIRRHGAGAGRGA